MSGRRWWLYFLKDLATRRIRLEDRSTVTLIGISTIVPQSLRGLEFSSSQDKDTRSALVLHPAQN